MRTPVLICWGKLVLVPLLTRGYTLQWRVFLKVRGNAKSNLTIKLAFLFFLPLIFLLYLINLIYTPILLKTDRCWWIGLIFLEIEIHKKVNLFKNELSLGRFESQNRFWIFFVVFVTQITFFHFLYFLLFCAFERFYNYFQHILISFLDVLDEKITNDKIKIRTFPKTIHSSVQSKPTKSKLHTSKSKDYKNVSSMKYLATQIQNAYHLYFWFFLKIR